MTHDRPAQRRLVGQVGRACKESILLGVWRGSFLSTIKTEIPSPPLRHANCRERTGGVGTRVAQGGAMEREGLQRGSLASRLTAPNGADGGSVYEFWEHGQSGEVFAVRLNRHRQITGCKGPLFSNQIRQEK